MKPTIDPQDYTTPPALYLAFELSDQEWKLGFTVGLGQPPRQAGQDRSPGCREAGDHALALPRR